MYIKKAHGYTAEEALDVLAAELSKMITEPEYIGGPSVIRQEEKPESKRYLAYQAIET